MVTCDDPDLWKRMWAFKDHGKSWDAVYERSHPPGFRWLHESFGTNWRLTEMQSAIGRIQLERMPDWHRARTQNAARISEALAPFDGGPVRLALPEEGITHAWYKYYAFVRPEGLAPGWDRDRIVAEIAQAGVPAMQGSCSEVYLEKAFDGTGLRPETPLKVARELGATSLMLLVHPTLSTAEMDKTAQVLGEAMTRARA